MLAGKNPGSLGSFRTDTHGYPPLDPIDAKKLFRALPSLSKLKAGTLQTGLQADAAGSQTYYSYDPSNGKLQYVTVVWASGITTVIQYDTENQYAWTQATFENNAAGQLIQVTADNRDGTIYSEYFNPSLAGNPEVEMDYVQVNGTWTRFLYDPGNTQRWSSATIDYTAASAETDATLNLRNGELEKQTYDVANGDALQTDATYSGSNATQWVYDTAGTQGWSKYVAVSSGANLVSQFLYLRDGGTESRIWDLSNGDALQTDTTWNPDGSSSQWVYDTAGTNAWYKYQYFATAGAAKESQSFYDRNGNIETIVWDPAHGDALQSDSLTTPTGAHQTVWDTAGTNGWSSYVADWNAAGQLTDQSWSERDGTSNTDFWTNGVLTQQVTIGAGGEKAAVTYSGGGSTTQLFDETGRLIYSGFLSASKALAVSTPAGWTLLGTAWYASHTYGVASFMDTKGDWEDRFLSSGDKLAGMNDVYKDGTSSITLVSTASGVGLDTLTATFDSKGKLEDIIENTTQGQTQNIVTISSGMLQQSLDQPGTLSFIEHGLRVLLVHATASNGMSESRMYWQDIAGSGSPTGSMRADTAIEGIAHYVGAVVGGFLGGLEQGVLGLAKAVGEGALVQTAIPGPLGAVLGTAVAVYSTTKAVDAGVTEGWSTGGKWGDQAGQAIEQALQALAPAPPPAYDPGGGVVADDNGVGSIGGSSSMAASAPLHVQFIAH